LEESIVKYEKGVEKIIQTRFQVEEIVEEATRRDVLRQSDIAETEANDIAQEQLSIAKPILEEAQKAVKLLDRENLTYLKKLHIQRNERNM
jgi:hypothetical protein